MRYLGFSYHLDCWYTNYCAWKLGENKDLSVVLSTA